MRASIGAASNGSQVVVTFICHGWSAKHFRHKWGNGVKIYCAAWRLLFLMSSGVVYWLAVHFGALWNWLRQKWRRRQRWRRVDPIPQPDHLLASMLVFLVGPFVPQRFLKLALFGREFFDQTFQLGHDDALHDGGRYGQCEWHKRRQWWWWWWWWNAAAWIVILLMIVDSGISRSRNMVRISGYYCVTTISTIMILWSYYWKQISNGKRSVHFLVLVI